MATHQIQVLEDDDDCVKCDSRRCRGVCVETSVEAGGGLLRLTPTWVPRSFLHPGRRLKLHPDDLYAYGAERGGIDERWFASTTEAANQGRVWHEGLSFVSFDGQQFTLKDAVAAAGPPVDRQVDVGHLQALAGVLQVLRQHGPDPASHAPEAGARPVDRPGRQAGKLLLLAAVQQRRQQLLLHLHGTRAGHDQGAAPQVPGETGARGTTGFSTCPAPIG